MGNLSDDNKHPLYACPNCGSGDISGGHFEGDGDTVWQNIICDDCDTTWVEYYTFAGWELEDNNE